MISICQSTIKIHCSLLVLDGHRGSEQFLTENHQFCDTVVSAFGCIKAMQVIRWSVMEHHPVFISFPAVFLPNKIACSGTVSSMFIHFWANPYVIRIRPCSKKKRPWIPIFRELPPEIFSPPGRWKIAPCGTSAVSRTCQGWSNKLGEGEMIRPPLSLGFQ